MSSLNPHRKTFQSVVYTWILDLTSIYSLAHSNLNYVPMTEQKQVTPCIMGWIEFSLHQIQEVLILVPQNLTVFVDRVFKKAVKVKEGHLGWPLIL